MIHLPKYIGGGLASTIAVLKYQADEAKGDIKEMELRIRELEAYSSANTAQIQVLLSRTHKPKVQQ
jgi:hypothetical protein